MKLAEGEELKSNILSQDCEVLRLGFTESYRAKEKRSDDIEPPALLPRALPSLSPAGTVLFTWREGGHAGAVR